MPLQAMRPILGTYEDIPAPDMNTGAREMVRPPFLHLHPCPDWPTAVH